MNVAALALWTVLGVVGGPRPKLVVVITVDQLRPDYLDRYRRQLIGGLGMLLRDGAVFTDAYQDHAITETAPGHATVLSGRWPTHTGIIRNSAGVQDSTAALLEVKGPGASPVRFKGSAFFDWLRAAEPGARALSVSRKDRAAILPIGRAKEQVYWYVGGRFTTSRYYADTLPAWVRAFNAQRVPAREAGAVWSLLLPAEEYPEPDSESYENGGSDFTFPHRLTSDTARAVDSLVDLPTMDSLTLAFALAGVRSLGLGGGGRGATDLLAVGLSTTDAIGHRFGPDSREIHDQVLRVDRYLGWFLGQLSVRYGPSGFLVVLTADHGVTPFPEYSRTHGHPEARRVDLDSVVDTANAAVDARVGGSTAWMRLESGMLLLPQWSALVAAGLNVDSVRTSLAAAFRAVPGVARVDRPDALLRADTAADPIARRWSHVLAPGDDVALVVTLKPYSLWAPPMVGTSHGQPSDIDTHVPLIFWGKGVRAGVHARRVAIVDVAPTLASLLDVAPADSVDGRPLTEVIAPSH